MKSITTKLDKLYSRILMHVMYPQILTINKVMFTLNLNGQKKLVKRDLKNSIFKEEHLANRIGFLI